MTVSEIPNSGTPPVGEIESEVTPDAPADTQPCPTPAQSAKKAIGAAITGGLIAAAAKWHVPVDPATAGLVGAALTGYVTYKLRNVVS